MKWEFIKVKTCLILTEKKCADGRYTGRAIRVHRCYCIMSRAAAAFLKYHLYRFPMFADLHNAPPCSLDITTAASSPERQGRLLMPRQYPAAGARKSRCSGQS